MALDIETIIGAGGTGGVISAVIHFFNREKLIDLKKEIDDHKKNLEEHKRGAITTANCNPCQNRQNEVNKEIKLNISDFKEDMKADMREMKEDSKEIKKNIEILIGYALQRRTE